MTGRHRSGGHRVAVTGIGVKSPAGNDLEEAYTTVLKAERTAASLAGWLVEQDHPVHFGALVPPFDLEAYLTRRETRQIDRTTQLLLCAAADAVTDAALPGDLPADRVGAQIGTGIGGLPSMEAVTLSHGDRPRDMPVHTVPRTMANSPACRLAMRYGYQGPCTTYSSACASGTTAVGEAARKIRYGDLDVAVAGGVDSAVTTVVMGAFARMRAMSTRNTEPELASRPFDVDRDGFVMGEGAAVLVLERMDSARARGARIYGEIAGYADTCDASHIVAPREDGETAARCMRLAIEDAGLRTADIGHINAHGTSTLLNDRSEARAVDRCFGGQPPPLTAVKGVTGHLIGGSGALEAALALLCAGRGLVPPIANLRASAESDLVDLVVGGPRTVPTAPVLSNSFGFGGQNACLVLVPTG
ncbi:beta-ketoacyl-[acyl-carrier-protein] synthase family protein [Streptomyces griseoviridis]|uniref:Beta-ketoacyl-[acyl-carrier-protein] synthase family protein n=1 Tax=Streptomyces hintoniae TaxID=3075521 RepID=A0ABU2UTK4_9ACTN|nr:MULTISPECIES: beta-ketoacyl-[acyl-carrier-protein] synthase family protein [unclassified Streptomyces]MDH6699313.1 3-oxoacyl-[acyl-carrier-protein] synthase II [Streptomyces sp. MAA16]MDT0476617.1 beta-ketoacyl-[acyl-carrier-protein] synthase family protein [Streptomyces sp. DSM 41014]